MECNALGWDADAVGRTDVCGSSVLIEQLGSGDMCVRESTFEDAAGLCQELGSRLCTAAELERGEGVPEACGFDSVFVWSWVSGGAAQCLGNSSLGVAGRPGEWFSFRPTASNALI